MPLRSNEINELEVTEDNRPMILEYYLPFLGIGNEYSGESYQATLHRVNRALSYLKFRVYDRHNYARLRYTGD